MNKELATKILEILDCANYHDLKQEIHYSCANLRIKLNGDAKDTSMKSKRRAKCIKDLPDNVRLDQVRVKIPHVYVTCCHLPRRNYYYVYSVTGFTTWVKTKLNTDQVHPIRMMSDQVLNLELYNKKKK